ncbi:MAG: hypothetical protein ACI915_000664 [Gammaproteobacteria bacterium]
MPLFLLCSQCPPRPTVVSGRLFVGTRNGTVCAIDAKSACLHRRFQLDGPAQTAAVSGIPGVIFAGAVSGPSVPLVWLLAWFYGPMTRRESSKPSMGRKRAVEQLTRPGRLSPVAQYMPCRDIANGADCPAMYCSHLLHAARRNSGLGIKKRGAGFNADSPANGTKREGGSPFNIYVGVRGGDLSASSAKGVSYSIHPRIHGRTSAPNSPVISRGALPPVFLPPRR